MQAYKCDICGNYYNAEIVGLETQEHTNVHLVNWSAGFEYEEVEIDICPQCTNALQEVIYKRQIEGNH